VSRLLPSVDARKITPVIRKAITVSTTAPVTVGLLHPGEMGAAIGAQLVRAGHRVLWSSPGRSAATAERATRAGLQDAGEAMSLAAASDIVLSVAPPAAAAEVAASIGEFHGLFVDANAIAPETSRAIAESIHARGGRYVDGGIIGPPPESVGDARLYLSGPEAAEVAAVFAPTVLDARAVGERIGDASAVKLAYAGWTKGSAALLLTMREYAARAGVEDVVLAEWAQSQPELAERWQRAQRSHERKGWRWVGEMEEIARGLSAVDLPDGFHRAAAEIYRED
jgi:3-hydroxyisobutyrate dehydrogenase-like beta-hydroxyacid dehydrogenase